MKCDIVPTKDQPRFVKRTLLPLPLPQSLPLSKSLSSSSSLQPLSLSLKLKQDKRSNLHSIMLLWRNKEKDKDEAKHRNLRFRPQLNETVFILDDHYQIEKRTTLFNQNQAFFQLAIAALHRRNQLSLVRILDLTKILNPSIFSLGRNISIGKTPFQSVCQRSQTIGAPHIPFRVKKIFYQELLSSKKMKKKVQLLTEFESRSFQSLIQSFTT